MFTRAGHNLKRSRPTGILAFTANVRGNRGGFSPAMLFRHRSGDLFWVGLRRSSSFVAWGEACVFRNFLGIHSWGLPESSLITKREETFA